MQEQVKHYRARHEFSEMMGEAWYLPTGSGVLVEKDKAKVWKTFEGIQAFLIKRGTAAGFYAEPFNPEEECVQK